MGRGAAPAGAGDERQFSAPVFGRSDGGAGGLGGCGATCSQPGPGWGPVLGGARVSGGSCPTREDTVAARLTAGRRARKCQGYGDLLGLRWFRLEPVAGKSGHSYRGHRQAGLPAAPACLEEDSTGVSICAALALAVCCGCAVLVSATSCSTSRFAQNSSSSSMVPSVYLKKLSDYVS